MEIQNTESPWLKSYDPDMAHELSYVPESICNFLDRSAREYPDNVAYIFDHTHYTWSQVQRIAETMAANLRGHGLAPGDRVALMFPNLPQAILSFWAVLKAGGIVVMTNPLYMETELVYQLTDAGARFLITADMCWPKIEQIQDKLPVEKYFVTTMADVLTFPSSLLHTFKGKRNGTVKTVTYDGKKVFPFKPLTKGTIRLSTTVANPGEETALLQYTGGTTGLSKGVILTHANFSANVAQVCTLFHMLKKTEDVFAAVLPVFHVYGLCLCILVPAALADPMVLVPRYEPGELLRLVEKHKISMFPGAPSIYLSLMQHKELQKYDLSSLKFAISGSAPISADALTRFKELTGCSIVEGFGLTECSPVTHLNPADGRHRFGSIGLPVSGTDARIVDMEVGTIELPPGTPGELIIRGPQVMRGYYNKPDETAGTLRNGWLYTGDIAYMDEDGFFYIMDRKKDMIIVGGYNVYPREIDDVLLEHPDIKEAVAVAVMHPTRGETLKAYVVLKDGVSMTATDVIGYCRKKLANYKVPRQVEFRDSLPRAMTGKVLRRTLRQEEQERYRKGEREILPPSQDEASLDSELRESQGAQE